MADVDVLLTGATGFIGKHFLKQLSSEGRRVRCMVRSSSDVESIRKFAPEIAVADLSDVDSMTEIVKDCRSVYHIAGKARNATRGDMLQTNRDGTRNLANACLKQKNPPTFIFISSLAAAGPSPLDQPRTESDSCQPVSKYGQSKLEAESALRELANLVPISVVRPPIVFGEEDIVSLDAFSTVKRFRIFAKPGFARKQYSLIHPDDLFRSVKAIESDGRRLSKLNESEGIYYTAYPELLTGSQFAELIGQTVSRKPVAIPIPHWLVKSIAAGNELISATTKWKPFLNWDKAREATAGSWTCDASKLFRETDADLGSLNDSLKRTAAGYHEKGWL